MTNADFERIVDTSDEWITTRTGIKERRICRNGIHTSDMAVSAIEQALSMSGVSHEDIDCLIVGTVTPDYKLPSTACVIQEKMNFPNAVGFDISAACTAFISGLTIARGYIESGIYKHVLVVGVEHLTSFVNYKDRSTCVLFGDAAGAAVLEGGNGDRGIVSSFLKSDGSYREWLWAPTGGSLTPYSPDFTYDGTDKIIMHGSDLFRVAVKEMGNAAVKVIEDAGLKPDDVSLVIPHQANTRIIDSLVKRLGVDPERVVVNIHKYGNTSSASVPLALDEANREGRIKEGDYVLMVAFGGGLIWGAALLKW